MKMEQSQIANMYVPKLLQRVEKPYLACTYEPEDTRASYNIAYEFKLMLKPIFNIWAIDHHPSIYL